MISNVQLPQYVYNQQTPKYVQQTPKYDQQPPKYDQPPPKYDQSSTKYTQPKIQHHYYNIMVNQTQSQLEQQTNIIRIPNQLIPNQLTRHHIRLENSIIIMNNCNICASCCKTCCKMHYNSCTICCKDLYNLCCCNIGCYHKDSPDMRCCGICYCFCPLHNNYYDNYNYDRCESFYPNINIYCKSPLCITSNGLNSSSDECFTCCCLPLKLSLFSICLMGTIFNDIINTIRGTNRNYLC